MNETANTAATPAKKRGRPKGAFTCRTQTLRIPTHIQDALRACAMANDRTASSMNNIILREYLIKEGYLPQDTPVVRGYGAFR